MTGIYHQQFQEKFRQLKHKREVVNEKFLEALTYVKPFEEVKKLFLDLKAIEAELKNFNVDLTKQH